MFLFLQIQDSSKAKASDTVVFQGPPVTEQVLWPRHCVQNSWGAELHKDLKVRRRGFHVASSLPHNCLAPPSFLPCQTFFS